MQHLAKLRLLERQVLVAPRPRWLWLRLHLPVLAVGHLEPHPAKELALLVQQLQWPLPSTQPPLLAAPRLIRHQVKGLAVERLTLLVQRPRWLLLRAHIPELAALRLVFHAVKELTLPVQRP